MNATKKRRRQISSQSSQTSKHSSIYELTIDGYLSRMSGDARAIIAKLERATLDSNSTLEPRLWKLIRGIQRELEEAKRLWN